MKRIVIPELLDSDSGTREEVADSLDDLRWINRYFGGNNTTVSLLSSVATSVGIVNIDFLDVAGASGDVGQAAAQRLSADGIGLRTTIVDRASTHLPSAVPSVDGGSQPVTIQANALQLPFADRSFDVVGSALFLHHLEPREIEQFIDEGLRVCKYAVIVNDLRRSVWHLTAASVGSLIYKSRITRHDSVASVRRAYTIEEMRDIFSRTQAAQVDFSNHFLFRMGAVLWRKNLVDRNG